MLKTILPYAREGGGGEREEEIRADRGEETRQNSSARVRRVARFLEAKNRDGEAVGAVGVYDVLRARTRACKTTSIYLLVPQTEMHLAAGNLVLPGRAGGNYRRR